MSALAAGSSRGGRVIPAQAVIAVQSLPSRRRGAGILRLGRLEVEIEKGRKELEGMLK